MPQLARGALGRFTWCLSSRCKHALLEIVELQGAMITCLRVIFAEFEKVLKPFRRILPNTLISAKFLVSSAVPANVRETFQHLLNNNKQSRTFTEHLQNAIKI